MSIDEIKRAVRESLGYTLGADAYMNLLEEINILIKEATDKFNEVFGKNVFVN